MIKYFGMWYIEGDKAWLSVDDYNKIYLWHRIDGSVIRPWRGSVPPSNMAKRGLREINCPPWWKTVMQLDEGI